MDDDDTAKPPTSLIRSVGAYAELYPDIVRRLRDAERSDNPEVRKRLQALHAALNGRNARRAAYLGRPGG